MKKHDTTYLGATDGRVTVDGRQLDPRLDIRNHSPTGFAWGYEGSGPAQLSLAILADYLEDDYLAESIYQVFKRIVVSRLEPSKSWRITGRDIEKALQNPEIHEQIELHRNL